MKYLCNRVLTPLAFSIMIAQGASAGVLKNSDVNKDDIPVMVYSTHTVLGKNLVPKNRFGVRSLDLTNPEHEKLVYERLKMAGIEPQKFPQLYRNKYVQKEQQLLAKSFKDTENKKQLLAKSSLTDADMDVVKDAHFFMDMNVGVSDFDGEPYLVVRAKSSIFGGTNATYIDIVLEDENGVQLAPTGATLSVGKGKNETAKSVVSLKELKQRSPDLEMIYVSSYVETEALDGTIESAIKYTHFPFNWEVMEELYSPTSVSSAKDMMSKVTLSEGGDGEEYKPSYKATHPIDKNGDKVIKVCLNRNHSDCDYKPDQVGSVNDKTYVNIPFKGSIEFPHEVIKVFASDEDAEGIDQKTNIFMQEGVRGGATKQSYRNLDNNVKRFSDYVNCVSYKETKKTICQWNIPREEGRFGNATLFSNIAEANWYINFAFKGKPYFRGRTSTYQVALTSEASETFGNFYNANLPKMKLGYSCLARGTDILMADGSTMAIEDIEAGDMVMGALAKNPETAQPMMVEDVSIGIEAIDMYRIHLADGNSILMTETHPISTTNKGIIWSKELEPGDRILTMDESVLVTAVSTESYQDNVFNLKLSPGKDSLIEEGADLGMFANGLLVGDLDTQDEYNYKDQFSMETQEEKLQRMPEKWKTDYLNSLSM